MASSIVVLTGPPGAGKSTVSTALAERFGLGVRLDGDGFLHAIRSGFVDPWLPESNRQNGVVISALARAAGAYAAGGYTVVVDGVVGPWFLERFLTEVGGAAPVHYVVLRPDVATTLARATARPAPALTQVDLLERMHRDFSSLGSFEPHVVDSSRLSLDETVTAVLAAVESGRHVATVTA